MPSNGTIEIGVLNTHDLDLYFEGQIFYCYAFL